MNPLSIDDLKPNQGNIKYWMESVSKKLKPIEQARWNQANIDSLFYAGAQDFVNQRFNFTPQYSFNNYYFNLIQQPVNMVTGYQRQNRKTLTYQAGPGGDSFTTDQYTKLMMQQCQDNGIYNQFSKGCELAAISGKVLAQPYLDFMGKDPLQGELKVKIWEYNSFLIDPFYRNADMSDCNLIWCQEFISKDEARMRFPGEEEKVKRMTGFASQNQNFYFLPENYTSARTDMLILSYIWYKSTRSRKKLFSKSRQQFFSVADTQEIEMISSQVNDLEVVESTVPTWKCVVVLNDQMMFHGNNPLGTDRCPMIALDWNYDPHLSYYDLRVRSLVRPMRDPQFLFNYKVITNNDIAASTINSGYKRKVGAVANEENLKKTQAGYDIIINEGFELADVEKIIPTAVPQSDLELATQMADLVSAVSGINMENWSGQQDKQISALTAMIKQAANLMVFQKYFDQWDFSFEQLGELFMDIVLNNWNRFKVEEIIGEEASPYFYNRIFSSYRTVAQEGILTATQRNMQAQQLLDINQAYGREVFPPSFVIDKLNIQGKAEAMEFLKAQEESASAMQQHQSLQQQAILDAQLKELYSKAASNIAMARERSSRSDSNVGLLEERLSEISKNQSLSVKSKVEALEKLLQVISQFGELESMLKMGDIQTLDRQEEFQEDQERDEALRRSSANEFMTKVMTMQQNPSSMENQNAGALLANQG